MHIMGRMAKYSINGFLEKLPITTKLFKMLLEYNMKYSNQMHMLFINKV